eukprot:364268-Chlamydomonas_euryale.AAC.23
MPHARCVVARHVARPAEPDAQRREHTLARQHRVGLPAAQGLSDGRHEHHLGGGHARVAAKGRSLASGPGAGGRRGSKGRRHKRISRQQHGGRAGRGARKRSDGLEGLTAQEPLAAG